MEPEVRQRRGALRLVSRCTSQISDSIRARDEAVYEASKAGASLGAIGEAAELDVRVVEQIVNEVSRTTAAESTSSA